MRRVADIVQQNANADDTGAPCEALWSFSTDYYEQPGVAAALIALQDRVGLDVNVILFGLWHGLSGRGRLDQSRLAAADRAVRAIRDEVVMPLRALRRRLKGHPDPEVRRLRVAVAALEFEAEKAVLHRLAVTAAAPDEAAPDLATRMAAACANLALCLGPAAISPEAAIIRDALARFLHKG